ncbi:MAG: nitroreductase family protein [Propionibacteriaceae bacterium]|jgi:nitroreductase|nr:nitroreductase family protein [Propionibacteriaceae bacterium]
MQPQDVLADPKDAFLSAMRFRRAIKAFDPDRRIAAADFDFLLEVARLSPSSNGLEPWNILVIESPQLREKLHSEALIPQAQLQASHLIAFTAKTAKVLARDSSHFRHMNVDVRGYPAADAEQRFAGFQSFLADKLGIGDNNRAIFDYAARQAYIAMANLCTAAAFIGVESCPLEGFVYAAAEKALAEAGVLELSTDRLAVMVALGYRSEDPHREQVRREMGEIVRFS